MFIALTSSPVLQLGKGRLGPWGNSVAEGKVSSPGLSQLDISPICRRMFLVTCACVQILFLCSSLYSMPPRKRMLILVM